MLYLSLVLVALSSAGCSRRGTKKERKTEVRPTSLT